MKIFAFLIFPAFFQGVLFSLKIDQIFYYVYIPLNIGTSDRSELLSYLVWFPSYKLLYLYIFNIMCQLCLAEGVGNSNSDQPLPIVLSMWLITCICVIPSCCVCTITHFLVICVHVCGQNLKPSAQITGSQAKQYPFDREWRCLCKQSNQQKGVTRSVCCEHVDRMDQFVPH